jgi:hypothetical protein
VLDRAPQLQRAAKDQKVFLQEIIWLENKLVGETWVLLKKTVKVFLSKIFCDRNDQFSFHHLLEGKIGVCSSLANQSQCLRKVTDSGTKILPQQN